MIGERIRQARLLAGLTQDDVANRLSEAGYSATKAVISKYEKNKSVPNPTLLLALTQILGVEIGYLLYEAETEVKWLAYRRHSALPAKAQEVVQEYARDAAILHVELHNLLYPRQSSAIPEPIPVTSAADAEAAAAQLRRHWHINDLPIENLTQAAEENGVIVIGWKHDAGEFDGLSGWCDQKIPVTVVNTAVTTDRRRFSLAHELGHLLMETTGDNAEALAHRFAAALIVPAEVAFRELGRKRRSITFEELRALKRRYGLSIQGWIVRARDLDIITENYARQMFRRVSMLGWRKEEPSPYVADEEPVLLRQMILHAIAEGLITVDRVRQVLPNFAIEEPVPETSEFPSATELLAMPVEQREQWMQQAFETAAGEDFEVFEAFGEEDF
jgi:Zn-dependent peptidase ImmA (M78 family)/DNA-binding XRE family transcriptional regulator